MELKAHAAHQEYLFHKGHYKRGRDEHGRAIRRYGISLRWYRPREWQLTISVHRWNWWITTRPVEDDLAWIHGERR